MKNGNLWRGYLEPLIYIMIKKCMHERQFVSVNYELWGTMCYCKLGPSMWEMNSLYLLVVAGSLIY